MKGQCLRIRNVDLNVTVILQSLLNGSWYYDKNVLVQKYANINCSASFLRYACFIV